MKKMIITSLNEKNKKNNDNYKMITIEKYFFVNLYDPKHLALFSFINS